MLLFEKKVRASLIHANAAHSDTLAAPEAGYHLRCRASAVATDLIIVDTDQVFIVNQRDSTLKHL